MILKYKYHSESGLLEAYRSYTLAQNNSLSDTVVITSTASDAERYNYCLEFICYNSKSIPKAQYISPILNYADGGISFTVPNNLTEFRGHVDMQLTGYDPDDNSIVFKSINKNCKAFDVEGSLCVLEKDLNETPNVFTEVLKQLEDLRKIHQDIIDEAMKQFGNQFLEKVEKFKWYTVKYYDNGKLIEEKLTLSGAKLTPPQYTLPQYCVLVGGWYNPATERIWNLDEDTVEGDMELHLNYMTDDVVISKGTITSFGKHTDSHIYVPEYYDGYKVTALGQITFSGIPSGCHIHFGNNLADFEQCEILMFSSNVCGIYFPDNHPQCISKDGYLYVNSEGEKFLIFAPRADLIRIENGCTVINTYAITNNTSLVNLILPDSIGFLSAYCIIESNLEELTLPANILSIEDYSVYNNFNLKRVIIKGDISYMLTDRTFISEDYNGNATRPTLYVQPQHYAKYKALNLAYDIRVI
ncbi:MAG: leucine-rich repeat domain-containing protein, partial [Clostridia bacterium]|nr:leucine-rich repeat domain-containing protein [Clostridia bacterium]